MDIFSMLLILFFLLFSFLAWRKTEWAVFVIVLALPSYLIRFQLLNIPFTALEGMILTLTAIWLLKKLKVQNAKIKIKDELNIFFWPVILFILTATISVFTSPDLRAAGGIWKAYFIEPILFLVVFINVIKDKKQVQGILTSLGLLTLIVSAIAIYQQFTGWLVPAEWLAAGRVTSVYGFPNAIGLFLAPLVTIFAGLLISKLPPLKTRGGRGVMINSAQKNITPSAPPYLKGEVINIIFYAIVVVSSALAIIFAQSKGALLGIFAGFIFYAIFFKGKKIIFSALLAIVIIITITFAPNLLSLQGGATVTGGGSLEIRVSQWQESLAMLTDRPILGAGLAGFQTTIAPYHQKEYIEIFLYPHNIFLNFWSEIGILGLIAFVWLIILFYKIGFSSLSHPERSYRESKDLRRPASPSLGGMSDPTYVGDSRASLRITIMAGMTTLLIHGLVDVPYFKNDIAVLFWIFVGLIVVIPKLDYNKLRQS